MINLFHKVIQPNGKNGFIHPDCISHLKIVNISFPTIFVVNGLWLSMNHLLFKACYIGHFWVFHGF